MESCYMVFFISKRWGKIVGYRKQTHSFYKFGKKISVYNEKLKALFSMVDVNHKKLLDPWIHELSQNCLYLKVKDQSDE